MNRCSEILSATFFIAACALLAAAGTLFHSPAWAERGFPRKVERGEMRFVAIPDVVLDGKPERMAHGVRVRDERNAIVMPGRVNGRTATVNYLRDSKGMVREVWILSAREAAIPLAPPPGAIKPMPLPAPIN
jgi:hypothetical protein